MLCLRKDSGYSNWTVDSQYLYCLAELNPALDGSESPWHKPTKELAAALDVALTCPKYRPGAPAWLDVEMEDVPRGVVTAESVSGYTDDTEAAELLAKWLNSQEG